MKNTMKTTALGATIIAGVAGATTTAHADTVEVPQNAATVETKSAVHTTQAQVESAKADVEQAQGNLDFVKSSLEAAKTDEATAEATIKQTAENITVAKNADAIVKEHDRLLIPGFYGSRPNGEIKIMTRGGGDVSGAIVANIANASVYENWTDVSGILMADPRIIENPHEIKVISYTELRELSYMGASVLHEEAIFPVRDKDIPIQIRNTNDPTAEGTIISDNKHLDEKQIVTGIAGKKDFSIITIKKRHMANEVGLIGKALKIFEDFNVSIEHIPSGIDSFSVVVETSNIRPFIYELVAKIKSVIKPDEINVTHDISLIATVGENMKNSKGLSGRLFKALGEAGVNIALISQTNDEINIIVGVHNSDYEKTINTIYQEFK